MPSHPALRPTQAALSVAAVVAVSTAWAWSHRPAAVPGIAAAAAGTATPTGPAGSVLEDGGPTSVAPDGDEPQAEGPDGDQPLPTTPALPATPDATGPDRVNAALADGSWPRATAPVLAGLPGLGPQTSAAVPPSAGQVLLATGRDRASSASTVQLFARVPGGWAAAGPAWPAHNALRGWTDHHHADDLHSPIGVFALTDAGGLLPDPGSKLPYTRSDDFVAAGTGFEDEPLAGAFDYVIAIDYNRRPGTSPLDPATPLGADAGTGIWLHVDHGGPTHGCVSLPRDAMKDLLRMLDPAQQPVVVMGDAASLDR